MDTCKSAYHMVSRMFYNFFSDIRMGYRAQANVLPVELNHTGLEYALLTGGGQIDEGCS